MNEEDPWERWAPISGFVFAVTFLVVGGLQLSRDFRRTSTDSSGARIQGKKQ